MPATQNAQEIAAEFNQLKNLVLGLASLMTQLPQTKDVDMTQVRTMVATYANNGNQPILGKNTNLAQALGFAQEIRELAQKA